MAIARALAFSTIFVWFAAARAQVDPSSALLLNSGATRDDAVESGRYTTRPRAGTEVPRKRAPRATPAAEPVDEIKKPEMAPNPEPKPQPDAAAKATDEASPPAPLVQVPALSVPAEPSAPAPEFPRAPEAPAFADDDKRLNLLEIEIAPIFVYDDSSSPYAHRRYNTAGTGFSGTARAWASPSVGVEASYASTVAGHASDAVNGQTSIDADHEWMRIGLRGRRRFGSGSRSPSLVLGLDYWEYAFNVPADAALRERLRTKGVEISLAGEVPVSRSYAWTFRIAAAPRAQSEEISTQNNVRSGSSPETNVVEAAVGGRYAFDRSNEIYWKLTERVEQTQHSGAASAPDFLTGSTPSNVPVMNSFTIFELGYAWGN